MNNAGFGKTMENVRKHRDIKLVTTDKRRNQLASEPNYHTTKYFSENLMAIEMKKTKVKMNKLIDLSYQILAKHLYMNFGMTILNKSINGIAFSGVALKAKQNYATRMLTMLLFILKPKIFMKTLLMMLKNGLTHLTMTKMIKDRFQQIKQESNWSF